MKLYRVYDTHNQCHETYTNYKTVDSRRIDLLDDHVEEIDSYPTLERETALAAHLGCTVESVSECSYGDNQYESDDEPGEYLVLTDSEADDLWDEQLERS